MEKGANGNSEHNTFSICTGIHVYNKRVSKLHFITSEYFLLTAVAL